MNPKLIIFAFLFCLTCIVSATAAAQGDSGGGGSQCPTSYSFKKNNGGGACGGDGLVTVIFNPMPLPVNIPRLTAIYYKGESLSTLPVQGYLVTKAGETNIAYCLTETGAPKKSFNNISPAGKLVLEFTYADGTICRTNTPD